MDFSHCHCDTLVRAFSRMFTHFYYKIENKWKKKSQKFAFTFGMFTNNGASRFNGFVYLCVLNVWYGAHFWLTKSPIRPLLRIPGFWIVWTRVVLIHKSICLWWIQMDPFALSHKQSVSQWHNHIPSCTSKKSVSDIFIVSGCWHHDTAPLHLAPPCIASSVFSRKKKLFFLFLLLLSIPKIVRSWSISSTVEEKRKIYYFLSWF